MKDPRLTQLADLLIHYSCQAKKGEKILIEAVDTPHAFVTELIRAAKEADAIPLVKLDSLEIRRAMLLHGTEESWKWIAELEKRAMEAVHCYIGIRGSFNVSELSDVPADKQHLYEKTVWHEVHHQIRVKKTRWVVLRWPTSAMAQLAEMSTEAFEDFFFNVCTLDYLAMEKAMQPLIDLMNQTDRVRIKGPDVTDLSFSIKGIRAIGCSGRFNVPDGEVFTAPIRDSINGVIQFNTPTLYRGVTHSNICLEFQNGRIVKASGSNTEKLNEVLDSDVGARYVGEFAIGFNPYCTKPMKDILFDEKMAGSIHLTPGQCYEEADNGNHSNIHWDMVLLQTKKAGGGEIYFDDRLIRKEGRFVLPQLLGLNPEHLL